MSSRDRLRLRAILRITQAGVLAALMIGCGPSLHELHSAHEAHDVVRRDAATFHAIDSVRLRPGTSALARFELKIKPGFYMPAKGSGGHKILGAWLEAPEHSFVKIDKVKWPQSQLVQLPAMAQPISAYHGTLYIQARLSAHGRLIATSGRLAFILHYQLCTVRGCEVPETRVTRLHVSVINGQPASP